MHRIVFREVVKVFIHELVIKCWHWRVIVFVQKCLLSEHGRLERRHLLVRWQPHLLDVDVDLRGAEMGILYAGKLNDRLLASGGPEFSGPFPVRIDANGDSGNDEIIGGDGPDNITDGPGDDVVRGGANDDSIVDADSSG